MSYTTASLLWNLTIQSLDSASAAGLKSYDSSSPSRQRRFASSPRSIRLAMVVKEGCASPDRSAVARFLWSLHVFHAREISLKNRENKSWVLSLLAFLLPLLLAKQIQFAQSGALSVDPW
jgi:hypothetical protein